MRSVLIASFSFWVAGKRTPLNGMIEPLISYFGPRSSRLDLIDGTHPGSSTVRTMFETYRGTTRERQAVSVISRLLEPMLLRRNNDVTKTQLIFKIRDFLSVFEHLLQQRRRYDLFIGLESIYTIAGILARHMGIIGTVVYYVSDYSPSRYGNPTVNALYLWLDRFCCYHADFVWDLSPAMQPARIAAGLDPQRCRPVMTVHNGLFPAQIRSLPASRITGHTMVFAGSLGVENGPELVLTAMRILLQKYPRTRLHFYGGPAAREQELRGLASRLGITKQVVFHGLITDSTKLADELRTYMVGVAPYLDLPGGLRKYADASKIRLYLGCGLPVVTTRVPPLGKEIAAAGAGLTVSDTPEAFADAVARIFASSARFKSMKRAAITFARNTTWELVYDRAITRMKQAGFSG